MDAEKSLNPQSRTENEHAIGYQRRCDSKDGGDILLIKDGINAMRKSTVFTQDEIRVLNENPNTAKLTSTRLSLTLEAKYFIIEQTQKGLPPKEIVIKLGYDPVMLGEYRTRNMVRNVLRDAAKEQGLHEGYLRSNGKRMDDETISDLECNPASYTKLKNEVIYLRKEVEFLKKISQTVISGKRGK